MQIINALRPPPGLCVIQRKGPDCCPGVSNVVPSTQPGLRLVGKTTVGSLASAEPIDSLTVRLNLGRVCTQGLESPPHIQYMAIATVGGRIVEAPVPSQPSSEV